MSRVSYMIKALRATIAFFLACIAAAMASAAQAYAAETPEVEAAPVAVVAAADGDNTQAKTVDQIVDEAVNASTGKGGHTTQSAEAAQAVASESASNSAESAAAPARPQLGTQPAMTSTEA